MSKKKLKHLATAVKDIQTYLSERTMAQPAKDNLANTMENICEQQYTIYRMLNGYAVCTYNNKRDVHGSFTQRSHNIVYVEKLTDIPTVMAANGAADAMGVKY